MHVQLSSSGMYNNSFHICIGLLEMTKIKIMRRPSEKGQENRTSEELYEVADHGVLEYLLLGTTHSSI